MHLFLNNFHQGGKYTVQIANHQAELWREVKYNNKRYLTIAYLQTDY